MKRIIAIIFAAFALVASANAQDARQRTVQTVVSDVLAQLPADSSTENNIQMKDLAANAPQSVLILCSMLQEPEKGANNLIEYAISGVCRFAAAPNHRDEYLGKVMAGLNEAIGACKNPVLKQYLQSELNLMQPAKAPVAEAVDAAAALKEARKLLKSDLSNDACKALYLLDEARGDRAAKTMVSALKSDDRAFRTTALNYLSAYADDAVVANVVKKCKSLKNDAVIEDVVNWLGDNKFSSQEDFVLSQIANPAVAGAAIEAAGKFGTAKCADALLGALSDEASSKAALKALKSFKGALPEKVVAALANPANATQKDALLNLAAAKAMQQAGSKVIDLASAGDAAAIKSLAGVVTPANAAAVAKMLDKAPAADVAELTKAFASAIATLDPESRYAAVKSALAGAANPGRFYMTLAATGTDASVADLSSAVANGSSEALAALMTSVNYKAAPALFKAGSKDDNSYISYINLEKANETNIDKLTDKIASVLENCRTDATAKAAVAALENAPTMKSFNLAAAYLDNAACAETAAGVVTALAGKCKDDLDYNTAKSALEKAKDVYSGMNGDAVYAIDQIKKLLSELKEPSPVYTLTPEEKKAGYEILFDGTNLDKWVGNKEGYRIVNNNIYVTAGYGNAGNLYTSKEYKDFVFRFEFCFERPGANNGVGLRAPLEGDAAYVGMCEVQVLDHDDPIYANLREYQVHGSVYGVIPAKRIVHKPLGEWGTEEIRVKGNHITVTVNGQVIVDGDIKEACQGHNVDPDGSNSNPYTVDHRNHPGMFNKTGHIGFLGHGAGVKFRNVRILDLSKK